MSNIFSIAIDGPAGAGKSTIARAIAERTGAMYLDTGAMYRAVGLYFLRRGESTDRQIVAEHCGDPAISVRFVDGEQRMFLFDEDVSKAIREPAVSKAASDVSAVKEVRVRLVELQREIARGASVVMDGRDIGTHVLPDATLKIYLTATAEVRAMRRYSEMREKCDKGASDEKPVYHVVLDEIVERDYNDSHRAASPLMRAKDAVLLDTSNLTIDEVVSAAFELLEKATGERHE